MQHESASKARSELARRITERAARMVETRVVVPAPGEPEQGQSALDRQREAEEQRALFLGHKSPAFRQVTHGNFNTFIIVKCPHWHGDTKTDRTVIQRLVDKGLMEWVNSCHSAAVLTDRGRGT